MQLGASRRECSASGQRTYHLSPHSTSSYIVYCIYLFLAFQLSRPCFIPITLVVLTLPLPALTQFLPGIFFLFSSTLYTIRICPQICKQHLPQLPQHYDITCMVVDQIFRQVSFATSQAAIQCIILYSWRLKIVALHPLNIVLSLITLLPPCASSLILHHWGASSPLRTANVFVEASGNVFIEST